MALTEQEKKQTLQDFGFNSTQIGSSDLKASRVNKIKELQKDYKSTGFFADLKGIGTDIATASAKRTQNVANIQQAERSGPVLPVRARVGWYQRGSTRAQETPSWVL